MPNDKHDIALELNEKVLSLIRSLNEHFGDDSAEVTEHLKRVSKYLILQSLKTFDDENTD